MKTRKRIYKILLITTLLFSVGTFSQVSEAGMFRSAARALKDSIKGIGKGLLNIFVDTEATADTSPTILHQSMTEILYQNDRAADKVISKDAAGSLVTIGIRDGDRD